MVPEKRCPRCNQRRLYFQRKWHWRWKGERVIASCGLCDFEADQAFLGEADALDHWNRIPRKYEKYEE